MSIRGAVRDTNQEPTVSLGEPSLVDELFLFVHRTLNFWDLMGRYTIRPRFRRMKSIFRDGPVGAGKGSRLEEGKG